MRALLRGSLLPALLLLAVTPAAPQDGARNPRDLEERLARAELLAGLAPASGPGVLVTLRHSPRTIPGVERESLMVRERDVNALLNALRAGGAEALAVGGSASEPVRLLACTPVTEGRAGLLVGGTTHLPPYRILAIGDARAFRAELYRPDGIIKKAALDELQMVEFREAVQVDLPAARSVAPFRYARAQGGGPGVAQSGPEPSAADTTVAAVTPAPQPSVSRIVPPQSAPVPQPSAGPRPEPGGTKPPVKSVTPEPSSLTGAPNKATQPSTAAEATGAETTAVGPYFGGKALAKYHANGCRFGERIPLGQRVVFKTRQEAERNARAACPFCAPQQTAVGTR